MIVLILDKFFLSSQTYIDPWIKALNARNHTVTYESLLRNLTARGLSLSSYDVAIVHPIEPDSTLLHAELEMRKAFRVIIHSGNNARDFVDIANSPQSYYASKAPAPEKLIELIEQGWRASAEKKSVLIPVRR